MNAPDSTLATLRANPDWAKLPLFDRSKWHRVRFGDVVENVNETCNPTEAGIERFIGLEHLEPGALHVRAWGSVADGTTFTRRCRSGQVLFGKRRAYQRKVAVAEFDAVVSGDIYVFAAKKERLSPDLLPFLCLSEQFFKFAVETSAGSLSPRTNWSHLLQFEFALPPPDQQRRIAEVLSTADQLKQEENKFLQSIETCRKRLLLSAFESFKTSTKTVPTSESGVVQLGRQRAPQYTTGRFSRPYLRVVNVLDGVLDLRDVEEMDFDDDDFPRYQLMAGDILITEGDITSPRNVGRSAIFRGEIENCCFQKTLIRFRPGETLLPEFAHAALQNAFYRGELARIAVTTTVSHLTAERFARFRLPVPSLNEQKALCARLLPLDSLKAQQVARIDALRRTASEIGRAFFD
jgi:type I restriction enzyme, S subunit